MTVMTEFDRLLGLAKRIAAAGRAIDVAPPSARVYARSAPSGLEATVYEPVICLILQGAKIVSTGAERIAVARGDALLVTHDVPIQSWISEASAASPYLAVILPLDLSVAQSVIAEMDAFAPSVAPSPALSAAVADDALLAALRRYLELWDHPRDARILGAARRREVHYRLLTSDLGDALRRALIVGGGSRRVARAIARLRAEFRLRLDVADLAATAGLSPSSFHQHFKTVTGTTPLQYQKDLRLIEARALLDAPGATVAEAAFAVGYESPAHFSRDFQRKFGAAPSRALRGRGGAGDATARAAQPGDPTPSRSHSLR